MQPTLDVKTGKLLLISRVYLSLLVERSLCVCLSVYLNSMYVLYIYIGMYVCMYQCMYVFSVCIHVCIVCMYILCICLTSK